MGELTCLGQKYVGTLMVYASKKYADLGISVGQPAKTFPAVFWFAVVASFVGIFCAMSKDNIFFKFLTTKL